MCAIYPGMVSQGVLKKGVYTFIPPQTAPIRSVYPKIGINPDSYPSFPALAINPGKHFELQIILTWRTRGGSLYHMFTTKNL